MDPSKPNPADTRHAVAAWLDTYNDPRQTRLAASLAVKLPTPRPGSLQAQMDELHAWLEDACETTRGPTESDARMLALLRDECRPDWNDGLPSDLLADLLEQATARRVSGGGGQ